jgi:hypothetical protein
MVEIVQEDQSPKPPLLRGSPGGDPSEIAGIASARVSCQRVITAGKKIDIGIEALYEISGAAMSPISSLIVTEQLVSEPMVAPKTSTTRISEAHRRQATYSS